MEIVSCLDPTAYIRYAATVQPKATVPVDLPCFGLCQSRNKTCPIHVSGAVLNWKKLTKYPRSVYFSQSEHFAISLTGLLLEVVTAINYSTIAKSLPTPPLNQSRHALPCEARLRSPENHSVL
ncbi:hypothetical protein EAF00_009220 [Botryotinia globosa]|nr:hypothetical protein EAF00_009220 [Botryotinia globosa]